MRQVERGSGLGMMGSRLGRSLFVGVLGLGRKECLRFEADGDVDLALVGNDGEKAV